MYAVPFRPFRTLKKIRSLFLKFDVKSLGQFKTEFTIFSFYFDLFELVVGQNKF